MVFESISLVFQSILNPIFSPLLRMPFLLSIILISFLISLLIVLVYKKFTNQSLMKELKEEIKELQKQMKDLRDKPQEMMKIQKRAMETNMKYMMHSLKPTLYTFIPIIIIFGWLNTHMAYYPLVEDQEFSVLLEFVEEAKGNIEFIETQDMELLNDPSQTILENQVKFVLKGKVGEYTLNFKYLPEIVSNNETDNDERGINETKNNELFSKDIIIIESDGDRVYKRPMEVFRKQSLRRITVSNQKILAFEGIPVLQDIPWVGGFGWLGSYILFSLVFSLGLRRIMKIY
ncbi:DUF106 domain-containing protein [Candidatus Woesearchaeota archaeon]|jgi:uncharacterized membrane protein (DUF106 family)|nr:DUF106 domain-containing protein [Candidatus Woesearchaeota archaeon]